MKNFLLGVLCSVSIGAAAGAVDELRFLNEVQAINDQIMLLQNRVAALEDRLRRR